MSDHPARLSDDLIAQFLRTRSAEADPGLLDDIVRTAGATRQDRPWLPLGPKRLSRRALLIVAIALLLATGAIGIGARLLRPDPVPVEQLTVVQQVVGFANARDAEGLRSSFATDATVALPQLSSDGRQEDLLSGPWRVDLEYFLEGWMYAAEAWDLEAELRSCQLDTESTVRCDVATRWHTLQVEMAEEWIFVVDSTRLTSLALVRVDPDPANRTLPLAYSDLESWESWLQETHPAQAATLLSGDNLFWNFYFRYHPSKSAAIGASTEEYLESRIDELQP